MIEDDNDHRSQTVSNFQHHFKINLRYSKAKRTPDIFIVPLITGKVLQYLTATNAIFHLHATLLKGTLILVPSGIRKNISLIKIHILLRHLYIPINIHFNTILTLVPRFPKWFNTVKFSDQYFVCIFQLPSQYNIN